MQDNNLGFFKIAFGNKTDTGRVRERNEDYMESFECSFGYVFVVCDGMGGHIGGEIASRLAASTIKNVFLKNPNKITSTAEIIEESIEEANKAVFNKSKEDLSLKGMGTTCIVLVLNNMMAFYGHAGDSRLYLIRGKNIYQLTRDHSLVRNLVDQNFISEEEAEYHPRRNEITKALGIGAVLNPDIARKGMMIYKDDIFILCSDGLSNMISEREIMEISLNNDPIKASNLLVEMANVAGGTDNITVQVIKIIQGKILPEEFKNVIPEGAVIKSDIKKTVKTDEKPVIQERRNKKLTKFLIPLIIVSLLIIVGLVYVLFYYPDKKDEGINKDSVEVRKQTTFTDEKIRDDIKSLLEYIYLSKPISGSVKFDRAKEFEYISNKGTSKLIVDSLRAKFTNNRKDKVEIIDESFKENECKFRLIGNDKIELYNLIYKVENNKIVFESIKFLKDLTPAPKIEDEKTKKPKPDEKIERKPQKEKQPKDEPKEKKEKPDV